MRALAINVGTNTVLGTIADLESGRARLVTERASITRLGEGVDRSRCLSRAACERTLAVLGDLAALARSQRVDVTFAVGTSALRDAGGGTEFVSAASRILGSPLMVLEGAEEARLTFLGATWELPVKGRVRVVDIGGGSTEIVEGSLADDGDPHIDHAVSLDIGSVRLFERFVRSDPPTPTELDEVRGVVRAALGSLHASPAVFVGVAGTVTTLVALSRGDGAHVPRRAHGATLSREEVRSQTARLSAMSIETRRTCPGLEPGRADVIPVGGAILEELLDRFRSPSLVASDRGVRWGLLRERCPT